MPLLLSRVLSKALFDIDREMHSHSRLGKARETFLLKKHFKAEILSLLKYRGPLFLLSAKLIVTFNKLNFTVRLIIYFYFHYSHLTHAHAAPSNELACHS